MIFLARDRATGRTESGSASVEFVVLAIPLFLPLFIYLVQFAEVSSSEMKARSLVRQVVRAYVTSSSNADATLRANQVLLVGAEQLGMPQSERSSFRLDFSCSANPCLTPGGGVRATLNFATARLNRNVRVSAQEYVSPWQ